MKPAFNPANTFAIVVGVERYDAGDKWALSGPALDAVTFVEWLRARGVPSDNIHLYLSPLTGNAVKADARLAAPNVAVAVRGTATTSTIRPVVQQTLKKAIPSTKLLYVFWGGHGAMESDQQRRLFCDDATGGDFNPINFTSLRNALLSRPFSGIRDQIVVVDACANFYGDMKYREGQAQVLFSSDGSVSAETEQLVLLAAASGEKAGNDPVARTGDFSRRFFQRIEQTPVTEWPDFDILAHELVNEFQQRAAAGDARQHPVAMRSLRSDDSSESAGVYPVSYEVQIAVGEGDVGVPQLRSLVSLALEKSSLGDVVRRDALVDQLPAAVRGRISRYRDDAENDLLHIFAYALGSEQHARELRVAIEGTETDAGARDELSMGIERVRLAVAVRARIGSAQLTPAELRALYRRSAPDAQRVPDAHTLDDMLAHLQDLGARSDDALPPVIEFVERVAQALSSVDLARWVTTWSIQTTGGEQPAVELRQRLAKERAAAKTGHATLYVDASEAFKPTTSLGPYLKYVVHDSTRHILGNDMVPFTLAKDESSEAAARRAMADVLQRASALMEAMNEMSTIAIELIVTLEQLNWNFDEWDLYVDDKDGGTFGINYPLTLRWVERARANSALPAERRRAWKSAARRIRDRLENNVPATAFWLARDGSEPRLVESKVKTEDYGSYVALEFVPGFDQSTDLERRLMRAVLFGGAPFVLWRRKAPTAWPTLKTDLDTFLGAAPLDELPQRCVALRKAALEDDTTLGHSLAVLWDDPDRMPPDTLLSHTPQRTP